MRSNVVRNIERAYARTCISRMRFSLFVRGENNSVINCKKAYGVVNGKAAKLFAASFGTYREKFLVLERIEKEMLRWFARLPNINEESDIDTVVLIRTSLGFDRVYWSTSLTLRTFISCGKIRVIGCRQSENAICLDSWENNSRDSWVNVVIILLTIILCAYCCTERKMFNVCNYNRVLWKLWSGERFL